MVRRRVSPELNAVSTLLFVVVLILLVIINVREARQEKPFAAVRRGNSAIPVPFPLFSRPAGLEIHQINHIGGMIS